MRLTRPRIVRPTRSRPTARDSRWQFQLPRTASAEAARVTKIVNRHTEHHSRGGRMAHEPGKIRNVAVVGHRGTGKTSLVEAMLFQAGATNRLGTIEAGSTVSDWDEDEQRRNMSLAASVCHAEWQGR